MEVHITFLAILYGASFGAFYIGKLFNDEIDDLSQMLACLFIFLSVAIGFVAAVMTWIAWVDWQRMIAA